VAEDLAAALAAALGVAKIEGLRRLSGGASRETWAFEADGRPLILRRDPPGVPKGTMGLEARLITAAGKAGMPVPEVITASDDPAVLGSAFLVMDRIEGETIARRILRDDAYADGRPLLAGQCGEALATLHQIDPSTIEGLTPTGDDLGEPHPAFELALRWLDANRPAAASRTGVVHGDFRNGNFIVGPEGLRAVLDWELAHEGDPLEDLGWLCVRAWRFGVDHLPAGGFGTYDDLVEAYERASGNAVDRDALHWWETLGTLKWGVMCILQASLHLSGMIRSVELAAIGRRVCENEWDVLKCLGPVEPEPVATDTRWQSFHDAPSAPLLVEAVREFLERDVMKATEGRVQFHTRVAINVLNTVQRELEQLARQTNEHDLALAQLGVTSERGLADAIRRGDFDARLDEATDVVRRTVHAKLSVANPKHL
jgi:aminoglycoside phosphotransferase (APT) family kinase protein